MNIWQLQKAFQNGFADEVVERGDDFISWNGGPAEKATLIRYKPESLCVSVGKKKRRNKIFLRNDYCH